MAEITEEELKKKLAEDRCAPLTVLAGEEKYLVKRALARLRKRGEEEPFLEFNFQEFPGETGVDAIADAVEALPFMGERKWVFVSDFDPESREKIELGKLDQLLENLPETTALVFAFPTLEVDLKRPPAKWKHFLDAARKQGDLLLCRRCTAGELQTMLCQRAGRAGVALSRRDAGRIIEAAGQDVTRLLGELEKLCAYALGTAGEGKAEITPAMIDQLVPQTLETTVFKLSDALTAGNYEQAYRLLDTLFYQREDPIGILAVLGGAYVDLARVKTAVESGLPAGEAAAYGDYKGREFRLRNAERSARRMSGRALARSLELLLEADGALKGSRLDRRIVLEELIAKLLLAAREEA